MNSSEKSGMRTVLTILFIASFLTAIGSSWYRYAFTKDYDYLVEAPCDPQYEICFYRDCEGEPDLCPPNYLSYYKSFYVKAYDFPSCSDNSCQAECENETIACTPLVCGENPEDVCEGE